MIRSRAAGGVVIGPQNKILIVSQNGNAWSLPKGHIDNNESAQEAAIREIAEESGISKLNYVKKLGTYKRYRMATDPTQEDKSDLKTITIFLYSTPQTELKPSDPDNPEARWVDITLVTGFLTHPKDIEFFNAIVPQLKTFVSSRT